jgi:hypothetical protein
MKTNYYCVWHVGKEVERELLHFTGVAGEPELVVYKLGNAPYSGHRCDVENCDSQAMFGVKVIYEED